MEKPIHWFEELISIGVECADEQNRKLGLFNYEKMSDIALLLIMSGVLLAFEFKHDDYP